MGVTTLLALLGILVSLSGAEMGADREEEALLKEELLREEGSPDDADLNSLPEIYEEAGAESGMLGNVMEYIAGAIHPDEANEIADTTSADVVSAPAATEPEVPVSAAVAPAALAAADSAALAAAAAAPAPVAPAPVAPAPVAPAPVEVAPEAAVPASDG